MGEYGVGEGVECAVGLCPVRGGGSQGCEVVWRRCFAIGIVGGWPRASGEWMMHRETALIRAGRT